MFTYENEPDPPKPAQVHYVTGMDHVPGEDVYLAQFFNPSTGFPDELGAESNELGGAHHPDLPGEPAMSGGDTEDTSGPALPPDCPGHGAQGDTLPESLDGVHPESQGLGSIGTTEGSADDFHVRLGWLRG